MSARADGSAAAFLGDGHLQWLDAGADSLRALPGLPEARAVAIAHRSPWVVAGSAKGVRRYDPETGTDLLRYPDSKEFIVDLAVSPDDRWVAATTLDGQVQLWELESGRPVLALRTHSVRTL